MQSLPQKNAKVKNDGNVDRKILYNSKQWPYLVKNPPKPETKEETKETDMTLEEFHLKNKAVDEKKVAAEKKK